MTMETIRADKKKEFSIPGLIMKHEGFSLDPYQLEYKKKDGTKVKEKFFTGGVGHKMSTEDIKEFDYNWTDAEKDKYWRRKFREDIIKAEADVEGLANEYGIDLTDTRRKVLTSMRFQMGDKGLRGFKGFLGGLRDNDKDKAADEMLDSSWANQTAERAKELSEMIRNESSN